MTFSHSQGRQSEGSSEEILVKWLVIRKNYRLLTLLDEFLIEKVLKIVVNYCPIEREFGRSTCSRSHPLGKHTPCTPLSMTQNLEPFILIGYEQTYLSSLYRPVGDTKQNQKSNEPENEVKNTHNNLQECRE
jgi:hypothetical protein